MDRLTWEFINSFAPWLAAIGTIAAVIVALYLARLDKRIRLEVSAGLRLIVTPGTPGEPPEYLTIQIVNIGHREAEITNIGWEVGLLKKRYAVQTTIQDGLSSKLPIRLKDGERAIYHIPSNHKVNWLWDFAKDFLMHNPKLQSRFIKIVASTSVGSTFKGRIEKGLREKLVETATALIDADKAAQRRH